jgi:predicted phage baseplate assembly protein
MSLPAPNLDDRRFQDLVDDAKRLVQRRCPEWTDHNVSDPGVTLIETFAFMTDQLLYRLNRVPDRLYIKFLEMIGVHLLAPTPARAPVTFWLSAPAVTSLTIATGTSVATIRTETEEPIIFSTAEELTIVPCTLQGLRTQAAGSEERIDRIEQLKLAVEFPAFSERPAVGDTMLIALSDPVPRCAVRLDVRCHIDGVGVDPENPPLRWEAWNGGGWVECEVSDDSTGGINRDGSITLHVPADHEAAVFEGERAGWLRARVIEAEEGQPEYSSSPIIHGLSASTIGGTIDALHATIIENETLGEAEGVPGQRFVVLRHPVLAGAGAPVLEVSSDEGWQEWEQVEHFAGSGPDDRHFVFDAVHGEVILGPLVREPDGGFRQYGAVPAKGSYVRMRSYTIGGGRAGNVTKGAIRTLKSSIPFVAGVENRYSARGGVDGETIEAAKARGPIMLRTRSRAVTAEDFEQITREAAPEVARVRALAAGEEGVDAGALKVLIVPAAAQDRGRIKFEDLVPSEQTLERVRLRLDETRLLGTRVLIEPPLYRGVTVVARLVAKPRSSAARIQAEALDALHAYLNPLSGGPDGNGWPFGRPVQAGEIYAALQRIRGVDLVEEVRVFGANPVTGERGKQATRIELEPNSLVFSYEHQVRVEAGK